MKTVQNNEIMRTTIKNSSHIRTDSLINIYNMFREISLMLMFSCNTQKIKIKCNIPEKEVFIVSDDENLRMLILYVLRYTIFASCSTDLSITSNELSDNMVEIVISASKKEKNINLTMDIYDKMLNFSMDDMIMHRLLDFMKIPFEKREFENKIAVSMKFKIIDDTADFGTSQKMERHMKFSPLNITFFDFL